MKIQPILCKFDSEFFLMEWGVGPSSEYDLIDIIDKLSYNYDSLMCRLVCHRRKDESHVAAAMFPHAKVADSIHAPVYGLPLVPWGVWPWPNTKSID